jgi:hypothetical protein
MASTSALAMSARSIGMSGMNPIDGLKSMSHSMLKDFQSGKRQIIQDNGQEFLMILASEYCALHLRLAEKDRAIEKLKKKAKR